MKINQRELIGAIVLLAIAVLLGVGYFVFVKDSEPVVQQPNPAPTVIAPETPVSLPITTDETANWKTYTNAQYGFSISFPSYVKAQDGKEDFVQEFPDGEKINNNETFCYETTNNTLVNCFNVHLVDNDQLYDLIYAKEIYGTNSSENKLQDVIINGNEGVSGEICEGRNCSKVFTFELKNNHRVTVLFTNNGEFYKRPDISPLAQQILSTFTRIDT